MVSSLYINSRTLVKLIYIERLYYEQKKCDSYQSHPHNMGGITVSACDFNHVHPEM